MIIIKLAGGLGNQLFQYAAARSISYNKKEELKLDISGYANDPLRSYGLKYFNIKEKPASPLEIFSAKVETKLGLTRDSYLEGYFQSEKYFENIKDIIKNEFTLKKPLSAETKTFAEKIRSETGAVSIHIRRTDYVTNKKLVGMLEPLSINYYERAIELIKNRVIAPHFFVFSDDLEWTEKNLKTGSTETYVQGKQIADYEELILMSLCGHNIMANSTFSWWGAWLNGNKNKIVIAPKNWFANSKLNTEDLTPKSWTLI